MEDRVKQSIKIITRVYYDYQREMGRLEGMLGIKRDGNKKKNIPERDEVFLLFLGKRCDDLLAFMKKQFKEIKIEVHKHPLWKGFLEDVKGVGELMAAVIITQYDIYKADTVSKL